MNKSDTYKTIFLSLTILIFVGLALSTDLTNIESIFPQGEDISVEGNLDMNSNSILSFFDSSCSNGEVVVGVNEDGSYQCVDVSDEVSSDYVDRDGDSMTGTLDMTGEDIEDVRYLNNARFEGQQSDVGDIESRPAAEVTASGTNTRVLFGIESGNPWIQGATSSSPDYSTRNLAINPAGGEVSIGGDISGDDIIDSDQISSGSIGGDELSSSYESGSEYDGRFVNQDGDSMSGNLDMSGNDLTDINNLEVDSGQVTLSSTHIDFEGYSRPGLFREDERRLEFDSSESRFTNTGVEIEGGDLDMQGNDIEDVSRINVEDGFQVPVGEDAW